MAAKSLIGRMTKLEIKVTKNTSNIQKLNDSNDVIVELVKNILEKLMELVDVLNERKIINSDKSLGTIKEEITTTPEEGGEK